MTARSHGIQGVEDWRCVNRPIGVKDDGCHSINQIAGHGRAFGIHRVSHKTFASTIFIVDQQKTCVCIQGLFTGRWINSVQCPEGFARCNVHPGCHIDKEAAIIDKVDACAVEGLIVGHLKHQIPKSKVSNAESTVIEIIIQLLIDRDLLGRCCGKFRIIFKADHIVQSLCSRNPMLLTKAGRSDDIVRIDRLYHTGFVFYDLLAVFSINLGGETTAFVCTLVLCFPIIALAAVVGYINAEETARCYRTRPFRRIGRYVGSQNRSDLQCRLEDRG